LHPADFVKHNTPEEAKKRILDENPHIAKDTLEFMLSLLLIR
jgi:hypothetical protein